MPFALRHLAKLSKLADAFLELTVQYPIPAIVIIKIARKKINFFFIASSNLLISFLIQWCFSLTKIYQRLAGEKESRLKIPKGLTQ